MKKLKVELKKIAYYSKHKRKINFHHQTKYFLWNGITHLICPCHTKYQKSFSLCSFTQKTRIRWCGEVNNSILVMIGYFKHDIFSRHASNLNLHKKYTFSTPWLTTILNINPYDWVALPPCLSLKGKVVKIELRKIKMPNDNLRDDNFMLSSCSSIVIRLNEKKTEDTKKQFFDFFSYQMINCLFF